SELPAALHFDALKAERRTGVRPEALCKPVLLHFLDALPSYFVFPLRASRHHCDAESPVHVLRVHAVLGTVKEHAAPLPRFHALQGVHSVAKGPVGADDKDYVARCQKRIHLAPFRPLAERAFATDGLILKALAQRKALVFDAEVVVTGERLVLRRQAVPVFRLFQAGNPYVAPSGRHRHHLPSGWLRSGRLPLTALSSKHWPTVKPLPLTRN